MTDKKYTLGIDIGSTTVKIAILDEENQLLFADYERHFANIQETLAHLLGEAHEKLGELTLQPVITGSGGLALANHLGIPFTQEVIAVSTSLKALAPQTDVAIELGGEDAKIIYFEGGNVEQRMNGICAGGTGSFIDQMASLLQTDATENIMMDAVKAGGDRQELHERIRELSMIAGKHVKEEGRDNDLLDLIAADEMFHLTKEEL